MASTHAQQSIEQLFPQFEVGDTFEIQPRSRVGKLRVRGTATVAERGHETARIDIACRILGVRSHGAIHIEIHDAGQVSVAVEGIPLLTISVTGAPQVFTAERLLLDLDPSGSLDVVSTDDTMRISASGLRIGEIDLQLARSAE